MIPKVTEVLEAVVDIQWEMVNYTPSTNKSFFS